MNLKWDEQKFNSGCMWRCFAHSNKTMSSVRWGRLLASWLLALHLNRRANVSWNWTVQDISVNPTCQLCPGTGVMSIMRTLLALVMLITLYAMPSYGGTVTLLFWWSGVIFGCLNPTVKTSNLVQLVKTLMWYNLTIFWVWWAYHHFYFVTHH